MSIMTKETFINCSYYIFLTKGGGDYQGQCAEALRLFPLPNRKLTVKHHETIGDLYMAAVYILGQLSICGQKDIFTGKTRQLKWSNPKNLREVRNYNDTLEAIKAIVDQGEGASPYNPLQQNVDSSELSHYFKFSSIYHGRHITTFNVTNEKVHGNNEEVRQISLIAIKFFKEQHNEKYKFEHFKHGCVKECAHAQALFIFFVLIYIT